MCTLCPYVGASSDLYIYIYIYKYIYIYIYTLEAYIISLASSLATAFAADCTSGALTKWLPRPHRLQVRHSEVTTLCYIREVGCQAPVWQDIRCLWKPPRNGSIKECGLLQVHPETLHYWQGMTLTFAATCPVGQMRFNFHLPYSKFHLPLKNCMFYFSFKTK